MMNKNIIFSPSITELIQEIDGFKAFIGSSIQEHGEKSQSMYRFEIENETKRFYIISQNDYYEQFIVVLLPQEK